jgi:hypothetical protein
MYAITMSKIERTTELLKHSNSVIRNCHPHVEYNEADLSKHNQYAPTLAEEAEQIGLDLTLLDDGPIALVVHDQKGEAIWGKDFTNTIPLVRRIDQEIRRQEKRVFGYEAKP